MVYYQLQQHLLKHGKPPVWMVFWISPDGQCHKVDPYKQDDFVASVMDVKDLFTKRRLAEYQYLSDIEEFEKDECEGHTEPCWWAFQSQALFDINFYNELIIYRGFEQGWISLGIQLFRKKHQRQDTMNICFTNHTWKKWEDDLLKIEQEFSLVKYLEEKNAPILVTTK